MDVSKNRGFFPQMDENLIKMDDLGVPQFSETPIYNTHTKHGLFDADLLVQKGGQRLGRSMDCL